MGDREQIRAAMLVHGVSMSLSAVALLASRLQRAGHTALAQRIGFAVDLNRHKINLTDSERDAILETLDPCPVQLQTFCDELRRDQVERV